MGEPFGVLCVLAIVLAIVTLLGHGLWLLAAWVIRALFHELMTPASGSEPSSSPALQATPIDDVRASIRQIQRLHKRGDIGDGLRDNLVTALRKEEARLLGGFPRSTPSEEIQPTPMTPPTDVAPRGVKPIQPEAETSASPESHGARPLSEVPESAARPPAETVREETVVDALLVPGADETPLVPAVTPSVGEHRPAAYSQADTARPSVTPQPLEPQPPQRSFFDYLQAFMEERNIRWGEIMAGMLIVGSAIGLVVSLWATLRESFRYFPALLFLTVTAGIFGAGMYTLRKWKLESTSRGMLIISLLLVPLNFLAAIAISEGQPNTDVLYVFVVAVGLAAYGAITHAASRVLVPHALWPGVLAVMGTSVSQLVIDRVMRPETSVDWSLANQLLALPLGCFLVAMVAHLVLIRGRRRLSARLTAETFLLLGAAVFALLMPLSLLVHKAGAIQDTLKDLAPALTTAAAIVMAYGLAVHQKVRRVEWGNWRMAGTSLGVLGGVLLLLLIVLVWPDPARLVVTGLLVFAALEAMAILSRLTVLHVPAVVSLSLATLLGFHLLATPDWLPSDGPATTSDLLRIFFLEQTSVVLTLFSALACGVAWGLNRMGRGDHASPILWGIVPVGAATLLSALVAGFQWGEANAAWASLVLAIGAILLLFLGGRFRRSWITSIGSALLLIALLQVCVVNRCFVPTPLGIVPRGIVIGFFPFLLHASVCCLVAAATHLAVVRRCVGAKTADDLRRPLLVPLSIWAIVTSSLLVLPVMFSWIGPNGWHAACAFWIAAVWLAVALLRRWQILFWLFQAMATGGVGLTVSACFESVPYNPSLLSLPQVSSQLAALAAWSTIWSVIRRDCRRSKWLYGLMTPRFPAVDRLCLYIVVAGVLVIAAARCLPGIDIEMGSYNLGTGMWIGNPGVVVRTMNFLGSHFGQSSAFILALLVWWSMGALSAWSIGVLRRSPFSVPMLGVAVLGSAAVWFLARVGIDVWSFDDVSLRFAATAGIWRLLLLATVAVGVSFLNRVSTIDLVGLVCLLFAMPLSCAAWFESTGATASALCWGLSLCGLAMAAVVWARKPITVFLVRRWRLPTRRLRAVRIEPLSALALLISTLPVVLISLAHALPVLEGSTAGLPAYDTLGAQAGLWLWHAGPLALLAVTLIGYAVRERSPAFALSGSLLINAAVTLMSVFLVWLPGEDNGVLVVVRLVQWNALALGVMGLAWLAGRRRLEAVAWPGDSYWTRLFGVPLGIQVSFLLLAAAFLTAWSVFLVVVFPAHLPESARLLSDVYGWSVLVFAALVGGWYFRSRLPEWEAHLAGCSALCIVAIVAVATHGPNSPQNWLAFHILSGGWLVVALLATAASCVGAYLTRRRGLSELVDSTASTYPGKLTLPAACRQWTCRAAEPLAIWATAIGGTVVLLAIRNNWIHFEPLDPYRPWWAAGLAAVAAALAAALALRGRNQPYAYASVMLTGLAASFVSTAAADGPFVEAFIAVLRSVIIAVAAAALVWVVVELWWQRRRSSVFDPHAHRVPVHHTFALLAMAALSLLLGMYLFGGVLAPFNPQTELEADVLRALCEPAGWLALATVGILLAASLWDRTAGHVLPSLYVWGLIVSGTIIQHINPSPENVVFGICLAAGSYALSTGLLWANRRWLVSTGRLLGVSQPEVAEDAVAKWLPASNVALAALTASIAVGGSCLFGWLGTRLGATGAVAAATVGIALLADNGAREAVRQTALILGALAAIALGWTLLTPVPTSDWLVQNFLLPRTVRLLVMLAATAFVYGVVLPRIVVRGSDWLVSVRRIAVATAVVAGAALLLALMLEVTVFDRNAVAPLTQILILAMALVGMILTLITMAVQRSSDPFGLTKRGRMGYVYAAEVVAALLCLHVYLTAPTLFSGIFYPYWPFIVMGIAFFAVGAGELLQRSGLNVLSEPLTRTGVFLPLLPAIGFWVASSDPKMSGFTTLLFSVGLLYVLTGIWRRSFVYVVLAALAGNATLWALLTDFRFSLLENPQLFVIPPALCVLVASHLNRTRLTQTQRAAARYSSLLVIYVASTGEMFMQGLEDKLWPPMVLGGLSVIGVLAGMLLRVRAFIYLGATFLLLSMLTMVWHAAHFARHSWPWWAFGFVTGILLMAMFIIFEMKRQQVRGMLETFRKWER